MRPLAILGIVLIVLGVAGLVYGGFSYIEDRDTADLGIAEVTITDKEHVNIPPVLSGACLVAGIVVLVMSGRRKLAT